MTIAFKKSRFTASEPWRENSTSLIKVSNTQRIFLENVKGCNSAERPPKIVSQQRLTLLIEQACFPLLSNCYFVAYLAVRKYSRSAHLYEVLFHLCFLCLLTQSSIRCRFSTLLMGKEASTKLKNSCRYLC